MLRDGFGVKWADYRGQIPGRGADRHCRKGAEADTEAGTFWDSEWVCRWRARLLLAGSAKLCD